jgi:hypothetical protein
MSTAFRGLYFREWKMMKGFFIGQFIVLIVMCFIPWGSALPEKLVELLILSVIIVPASTIFSLNTEVNQMELFLHNPQSVHKLLFVKLLNGFVFAMIYALVLIIVITVVHMIWPIFNLSSLEAFLYLLNFTLRMIISSIPFVALLLFLWTVHQILRRYLGIFSLVIVVAVLIIGSQLIVQISHTDLYQTLASWGVIEMPFNQSSSGLFSEGNYLGITVYLGNYIFYGVISVILYLLSAYLIDHKVEV